MERKFKSIGAVADRLHITVRTIRFYEELGLIAPRRMPTGARHLDSTEVARLDCILALQRFGFSLQEIKLLLGKQTDRSVRMLTPKQAAAQLDALQRQRDSLDARIEELRALSAMLQTLEI